MAMGRSGTIGVTGMGLLIALTANAATTSNVCPDDRFSWGENIGWMNWKSANGGAQGVRVYPNHLAGFIWCENVGWVNAGAGAGPYANTTGANFGVNIGAGGVCSGLAWGENIGWVNFNTTPTLGAQGARFDSATRRFRGYAWGENVGWINLDVGIAGQFVAALLADTDGDGDCDFADLNRILSEFGQSNGAFGGDVDGDRDVDFADLNIVLSLFGQTC